MPVRLKLRGGRCWLMTPQGAPAVVKPNVDSALVKGLRAAHRLAGAMACAPSSGAPASAYDRVLCTLAFLAPDIQRAILEGRQPPGFNLQRLIHGAILLGWAEQRVAFGFRTRRHAKPFPVPSSGTTDRRGQVPARIVGWPPGRALLLSAVRNGLAGSPHFDRPPQRRQISPIR
jgi:hypothetical protein